MSEQLNESAATVPGDSSGLSAEKPACLDGAPNESRDDILRELEDLIDLFRKQNDVWDRFDLKGSSLVDLKWKLQALREDHPLYVPLQVSVGKLELFIAEFERLKQLAGVRQIAFQNRFDDMLAELRVLKRDSLLRTAEFFEKIALLCVALLGASIGGLMTLASRVAVEQPIFGRRWIVVDFTLYILAIGYSLFGHFSAIYQSSVAAADRIHEEGASSLKESADVYLSSETKRKAEHDRIEKESQARWGRGRRGVINRLTAIGSAKGGIAVAIPSIVAIVLALSLFVRFVLMNLDSIQRTH
jgi:hypothetical protein